MHCIQRTIIMDYLCIGVVIPVCGRRFELNSFFYV